MTFDTFQAFALSWGMLGFFVFFIGAVLWLWRPGARAAQQDAAQAPFRHENAPAEDQPAPSTTVQKTAKKSTVTPHRETRT